MVCQNKVLSNVDLKEVSETFSCNKLLINWVNFSTRRCVVGGSVSGGSASWGMCQFQGLNFSGLSPTGTFPN